MSIISIASSSPVILGGTLATQNIGDFQHCGGNDHHLPAMPAASNGAAIAPALAVTPTQLGRAVLLSGGRMLTGPFESPRIVD
jgi:hypothetical protein